MGPVNTGIGPAQRGCCVWLHKRQVTLASGSAASRCPGGVAISQLNPNPGRNRPEMSKDHYVPAALIGSFFNGDVSAGTSPTSCRATLGTWVVVSVDLRWTSSGSKIRA